MQAVSGWSLGRTARYAVLFVVGFGLIVPAFADPPSQAPAHGWRKKHDPYYVGYTGHQWSNDYGIIDGHCNREALGAVLGGAGRRDRIASGDGDGRVVAIVLGTVWGPRSAARSAATSMTAIGLRGSRWSWQRTAKACAG
jgi:hypothetical protein